VSRTSEVLKDEMSVALMRWAEENGIVSHVELADFTDTGRGMALKCSIGADEPLHFHFHCHGLSCPWAHLFPACTTR
jgi:hypothetical protein